MQFNAADQAALIATVGETVTFAAVIQGGDPTTCTGFFRLPWDVLNPLDGMISTTAPTVLITSADAATQGAAYGRALSVRSTNYTVTELQPENSGMVRLILKKA
jgi:hypothetical protein